jgi:hypothetical protein
MNFVDLGDGRIINVDQIAYIQPHKKETGDTDANPRQQVYFVGTKEPLVLAPLDAKRLRKHLAAKDLSSNPHRGDIAEPVV